MKRKKTYKYERTHRMPFELYAYATYGMHLEEFTPHQKEKAYREYQIHCVRYSFDYECPQVHNVRGIFG